MNDDEIKARICEDLQTQLNNLADTDTLSDMLGNVSDAEFDRANELLALNPTLQISWPQEAS